LRLRVESLLPASGIPYNLLSPPLRTAITLYDIHADAQRILRRL
jgi:hypothetical protein